MNSLFAVNCGIIIYYINEKSLEKAVYSINEEISDKDLNIINATPSNVVILVDENNEFKLYKCLYQRAVNKSIESINGIPFYRQIGSKSVIDIFKNIQTGIIYSVEQIENEVTHKFLSQYE
jgi:hypothetical protein